MAGVFEKVKVIEHEIRQGSQIIYRSGLQFLTFVPLKRTFKNYVLPSNIVIFDYKIFHRV